MSPVKFKTSKLQKSFAIVIVACVAIIFFAGFDDIQAKARDTKRRADIKEIGRALELYFDRHGMYPQVMDSDFGGWDTTVEPDGQPLAFINALTDEGILSSIPQDPVNNKIYYYRYQRFEAGAFGCTRPFVVVQIFNYETGQDTHGSGSCPDRNFVDEAPNGFTIQKFE